MVKCPKQEQSANWIQVEIENLIVKEIYRGQTPQNLKLKIFLQKNSKTSTPLVYYINWQNL